MKEYEKVFIHAKLIKSMIKYEFLGVDDYG
jgi:hypothetical protein